MTEKRRGRPPKSVEVETPGLPDPSVTDLESVLAQFIDKTFTPPSFDPSITALEYRALMSDLQTLIAVAVRSGQMNEARRLQAELNLLARAM